jgi:SPP1 family predicted phage head-tail adaptor
MRIGDLNKRIDIQAQTRTPDGLGGFTVVYATIASQIAAAIWPVSASETVQAAMTVMTITHRIRIRFRSGLRASYRVSWAGRYFSVVSIIDPNTAHRFLDLMCKEAT